MGEAPTNNGSPTPNGSSPQISRELRRIKEAFARDILPQIREKRYFASKNQKRRQKKPGRFSCRKPNIRFSPFAMTLGNGLDVQPPVYKRRPVQTAAAPSQSGQIISVFVITVIARVAAADAVYVLQKIQKKPAPGFPGGGIENGENILQAATREFKEETSGKDFFQGVNIAPYNPLCIGKFVLGRAVSGEQGAVVLVEIPESEIANLKAGGGAEEGEVVEELFFWTFDEVSEKAEKRTILPNSIRIWNLYCEYLVNAP